jgi:Ca2+-binding EF-hand superfamily protein
LSQRSHGETLSEEEASEMKLSVKEDLEQKLKEREAALEKKLKDAPLPDSTGGGWIKAMFDSMDEDKDGMITVDQLKVSSSLARSVTYPEASPWLASRSLDHDRSIDRFFWELSRVVEAAVCCLLPS